MPSLTWGVSYHWDRGFRLHLNETPIWVEAVLPMAEKIAGFLTNRRPFSYVGWIEEFTTGVLLWFDTKSTIRAQLDITPEQAFEIQPGVWESLFDGGDNGQGDRG